MPLRTTRDGDRTFVTVEKLQFETLGFRLPSPTYSTLEGWQPPIFRSGTGGGTRGTETSVETAVWRAARDSFQAERIRLDGFEQVLDHKEHLFVWPLPGSNHTKSYAVGQSFRGSHSRLRERGSESWGRRYSHDPICRLSARYRTEPCHLRQAPKERRIECPQPSSSLRPEWHCRDDFSASLRHHQGSRQFGSSGRWWHMWL
jgi:hypothetical protein